MSTLSSNPMSINQLVQAVLDENPGTEHTYVAQNHRVENERKRRYAAMIGLEVAKRMQQRAVVEPKASREDILSLVQIVWRQTNDDELSPDEVKRLLSQWEAECSVSPPSVWRSVAVDPPPPGMDRIVLAFTGDAYSAEYANELNAIDHSMWLEFPLVATVTKGEAL
jgi:hypothetical protein